MQMCRFLAMIAFVLGVGCGETVVLSGSKCIPLACAIDCPHGLKKDPNGCALCACDNTSTCPPLNCTVSCPNGVQMDANGCATCTCIPPPNPPNPVDAALPPSFVCHVDSDCPGPP